MGVCLFCNTSMTPISGSQRGEFRSVSAGRLQEEEIYFDFVCHKNCPVMIQIRRRFSFLCSPTD